MSSAFQGNVAKGAARPAARRMVVLASLLVAGQLLLPGLAWTAAEGARPPVATATRESPYARYAREHAKAEERKPARVKASQSSAGQRQHVGARSAKH